MEGASNFALLLLICGAVFALDEATDFSSRFKIENYPDMLPGIYYENLGPVRLIGAEYKIVTYLSLEQYNSKYEELGHRIKNMEAQCKGVIYKELCKRYNFVIWGLFNEISEQKNHMYESLGKTNDTNEEEGELLSRRRRGLINIVGTALNTLFGVCDDNCIQSTTNVIKKTEEGGNRILHIMKSQTTVIKATIKQVGNIINETNKMYEELKVKEKELFARINELTNTTNKLEDMVISNELHNIYTTLTIQYAYETTTINNIVTAARGGVIHSSLMTPKDMAETLKEVAHRLRSTLSIPMGTRASELYELHKITDMIVYYGNDRLVFITKIPLVTEVELNLYSLIPVPMRNIKSITNSNTTNHFIVKCEYPYLAITKDRKRYTTFTEQQFNICKETMIYRICPVAQPVQENNGNEPCEVSLFDFPDTMPNKCDPRVMQINRNIYHKLLYQNVWLYSVTNDSITVSCTDLPEPQIYKITGHGKITLKDSTCIIYTKNSVLTAVQSISSSKYIDFIPKTNMSELLEKIPDLTPLSQLKDWSDMSHIKFNNLNDVSHSLDDLSKMINVEQERRNNILQIQSHSNMNFLILGLFLLTLILIFVIYILIKFDIKCRKSVDIPPPVRETRCHITNRDPRYAEIPRNDSNVTECIELNTRPACPPSPR